MSRRYVARKSYRKVSRPSEKIVRVGQVTTVPGSNIQGYIYTAESPQTVMNIKLDVGASQLGAAVPHAYALVLVEDGYQANNINYPALTTNMYEPSQNILISGIITDGAIEDNKYLRIGRKLKTGDRICLLFLQTAPSTGNSIMGFELSFTALF